MPILFTFILLVLTSIPYAYAALICTTRKQFMDFILVVSDYAQYLSWYKAFQSNFLTSNRLLLNQIHNFFNSSLVDVGSDWEIYRIGITLLTSNRDGFLHLPFLLISD